MITILVIYHIAVLMKPLGEKDWRDFSTNWAKMNNAIVSIQLKIYSNVEMKSGM